MARSFKTLDDMGDLTGKRVLVREDLNVPLADGKVSDDTRLRAAVPTVSELSDRGAIVLILAHFGRPKGKPDPTMSLSLVTQPLAAVLGRFREPPPIVFVTAHESHAVEAFDLQAVDYVLKPVRAERLAEAVRRVVDGGERQAPQHERAFARHRQM